MGLRDIQEINLIRFIMRFRYVELENFLSYLIRDIEQVIERMVQEFRGLIWKFKFSGINS